MKRGDAEIAGRSVRDLRGTAVTMLAMAGRSEAEIATISGPSLDDTRSVLDEHHLRRNTRSRASGIAKLDAMVAALAWTATGAARSRQ